MTITAVNNDVSCLKERQKLFNALIHRLAGLHQHHDLAGTLQGRAKLGNSFASHDLLPLPATLDKGFNLIHRAIIDSDGKPVALHVEDEVFPHDGESDHGYIRSLITHALLPLACLFIEINFPSGARTAALPRIRRPVDSGMPPRKTR